MFPTVDTTAFQELLDNGVKTGIGPGFQCVVFDRDSFAFNGVSGWAAAPTAEALEGRIMKPETPVGIASCSKLSVALVVLHIIERGLTKSGFSLKDLDNHEALIDVLPEFKHGSGSLVTKIIEGLEDELGKDGKKIMKLRDAKGRVTLRMLLTHTAGLGYEWNHPLIKELYHPSDDSVPHFSSTLNGNIRDFEIPLIHEPGTAYHYSVATDWLGQFAVRSTGRNLRDLFKEIIFQPLGIPSSETDLWFPPLQSEALPPIHLRDANSNSKWTHMPAEMYTTEGMPPEGKAHCAGGGLYSSLQAYAKVLQAVLDQNPVILSKEVWQMAVKDDLKPRGLGFPKPAWKSEMLWANDAEEFAKSTTPDGGAGVNLLACHVALAPTVSGRSATSFGWAGITNTYYFIDPIKGVGAIFGTQILPFFDAHVIEMRDELEAMIYKNLVDI